MSIASEITRLQGVKADILQAIADKGVTVPADSMLANCPDLIASISGGGSAGVDVSEYFVVNDAAVVINAYKLDNLLHIHFEWNYNLHQNAPSGDNVLLATLTGAPFKFKYKFQQTVTGCHDNNKMPNDRIGYIGNWGTSDNQYYNDKLVFKTGSSVRFWYCDFVVEVIDL